MEGRVQRDPVGLDPSVLGGHEAVEQLGEVLDHVVALGLAVHQYIQAEALLEGDALAISARMAVS